MHFFFAINCHGLIYGFSSLSHQMMTAGEQQSSVLVLSRKVFRSFNRFVCVYALDLFLFY